MNVLIFRDDHKIKLQRVYVMKAVLHTKYGPPDELQLGTIEKPVPKENEILVKIHAASVTTTDCNLRNFTFVPKMFMLPAKMMFGAKIPKIRVLGVDFAGEIEEIGSAVTKFKRGDHVFGAAEPKMGAHAEYIALSEADSVVKKPDAMSWQQAAALPLAGYTALYFIRDLAKIKAQDKILIIGASGGIGTYAVQLAKYYGAEVTGVCSGANLDLVKSLGADQVIDYTKQEYAKSGAACDFIFDIPGKISYSRGKGLLKKKGVYLVNLIELPELVQMIRSRFFGGRKVKGGMAVSSAEYLTFLSTLFEQGKLKVVIDREYPLDKISEAFAYVEQGHKKGNVVINVI